MIMVETKVKTASQTNRRHKEPNGNFITEEYSNQMKSSSFNETEMDRQKEN